jgi:uncharacterized protein (DUF4415 family)
MKFVLFLYERRLKMNKNSISQTCNSQTCNDDYPEISQSDLNRAVKRRNFATVSTKQNVNLTLDADIITWLQQQAGGVDYQSIVNSTLREAMTRAS